MTEQDKIIRDLIDAMDNGIDQFDESIQGSQKAMYAKILELTKDLELSSNGNIKATGKNLRVIRDIKSELEKAILNDKYLKSVDKYLSTYATVTDLQEQYYKSIDSAFLSGQIFKELRNQSVISISNLLTQQGLSQNITSKVEDLLRQNIISATPYVDLQEQMRTFLLNDDKGDGALARYSKQITTDALFTYSANYTSLATDDLGLEWYRYTGSLIRTSRAFCVAMIDSSCEYFHISEFAELLKGNVCGVSVPLNKTTGLPDGFRKETTIQNLISLRGGYSCRHLWKGVSDAVIPQFYWDKVGIINPNIERKRKLDAAGIKTSIKM